MTEQELLELHRLLRAFIDDINANPPFIATQQIGAHKRPVIRYATPIMKAIGGQIHQIEQKLDSEYCYMLNKV